MEKFIKIVDKYDYPCKGFDFIENTEITFTNYRDLELYIKNLLMSHDKNNIKNGLANVLYWGHYRVGYRDVRVDRFFDKIKSMHLQGFQTLIRSEKLNSIEIKRLGMPEFSGLAFISKVNMFLDPRKYVTLDKKIMQLRDETNSRNPLSNIAFSENDTSIRISENSQFQYHQWCKICKFIANEYFEDKIAADVERGFFKLVENNELNYGRKIIKDVIGILLSK